LDELYILTDACLDRKEIKRSFPCYPMKRGSKKKESVEADSKKLESGETGTEKPGSGNTLSDRTGADGILALQIITGGIGVLLLVWLVLRDILHIF
jgi:hypothetical protein